MSGVPIGQIVGGKYRVVRLIGDGGMGSVYEAKHEGLGTRVALKFLHVELGRTGVAARFLQEARVSASIHSPHVVRVFDVDQTPEGQAFIVLEYLEGRTLQTLYEDLAREGKQLSHDDALEYAMQIFDGVEAAHATGVVHRDLKPDNIMIMTGPKGHPLVKVLDFGIAKLGGTEETKSGKLTRPGVILGTPEYMAPEQVYSAGDADARADVFSLGVILFEMLGGRRPTGGDDPQQIAMAYLTGEVARLEDLAPGIAPALAAAVHRAMAPLPADRFSSVREMREVVEPYAPPPPPRQSRVDLSVASLVGDLLGPNSVTTPSAGPVPSAGAPRGIPRTWVHGEGSHDGAAGSGMLAAPLSAVSALSVTPAVSSKGTTVMPSISAVDPAGPTPPAIDVTAAPPEPPAPEVPHPSMPFLEGSPSWVLGGAPPASGAPYPQSWPYGPTASAALAPAPRRRGISGVAILLICLAVAGVAGGIGWAIYYFGDDDPPKTAPKKSPPRAKPAPTPTHKPGH